MRPMAGTYFLFIQSFCLTLNLTPTMCRGCLHFHTTLTGVLSPYLLQMVAHSPMFQKAIEKVYNSMISAELPAHLHIKYLIQRSDPALKLERRNYAAVIPGSMDIASHGQEIAYEKNIHNSLHNNSCVNRFMPYCRYVSYTIFQIFISLLTFFVSLRAGTAKALCCARTLELALSFQ